MIQPLSFSRALTTFMIPITLQPEFSWVTFHVLKVLQGCVDHRTFVRVIPRSRRRLQHSTFTFHIMPSNNQLTYHHAHKLTRTFVWIAFFVCTEFDRDINNSTPYFSEHQRYDTFRVLKKIQNCKFSRYPGTHLPVPGYRKNLQFHFFWDQSNIISSSGSK